MLEFKIFFDVFTLEVLDSDLVLCELNMWDDPKVPSLVLQRLVCAKSVHVVFQVNDENKFRTESTNT